MLLIKIDGKDFQVSRTLYSALVHLRFEDENRLLWIDAICINQDNISERNWQVSRMGLIYRSTLHTIAWLGTATWGSDVICTSLLGFQTTQEGNGHILVLGLRNVNASLFGSDDAFFPHTEINSSLIHVLWDQLDQLVERSLWSRAWAVQEFVLACRVKLYCGNFSFPYDTLEAALSISFVLRQCLGFNSYIPLKTGLLKFATYSMLRGELRETDKETLHF
jgi:hypothetical protein